MSAASSPAPVSPVIEIKAGAPTAATTGAAAAPTTTTADAKAEHKVIKIQDLPPIKEEASRYASATAAEFDTRRDWLESHCPHRREYPRKACTCTAVSYVENMPVNVRGDSNAFYGAFVQAYNKHGDIVLSPDDVWMMVALQFSQYVNDNAEKMRTMFVDHAGKKKLSVTTRKEVSESEWTEFFTLMMEAIRTNTKAGVVSEMACNFSTTGVVEQVLSTAVVMDSFQKFFEYGRCIPCCGIANARFLGTLADWESVVSKLGALRKYAVTPAWSNYVDELMPVLTKLVDTYNGKVDVDFWNRVMNFTHGRLGSGGTTYVSGWILKFFLGLGARVDTGDIKSRTLNVPVQIDNHLTGLKKDVTLIGGFGGVHKTADNAFRPQLSMIVYWDGSAVPLSG